MGFRNKFGCKITTIIDCFELFIGRPTNLSARNLTWSNYKSHNTGKYLIGITPQGTISFISKSWGGRASDQHITENSKFLIDVVYNDVIMADRGFDIAEILGLGAKLEIPSFTKGQDQMRAEDVKDTRVIVNVRIHVERVIGNLRKKCSILNGTSSINYSLPKKDGTEKLTTLDKVVHTTFGKTKDTKESNCLQKMENVLCKKLFPLRSIGFLPPLQVYLVILIKCHNILREWFFSVQYTQCVFCKTALENYFS